MICERLTTGVIGDLYTENLRHQPTTDGKALYLTIGARMTSETSDYGRKVLSTRSLENGAQMR